jgi:glycosyltransferase involved in cell wall biosynthesis
VVVPVFNAPDETIRCFESLIAHTPTGVDILVIDDCGHDRLAFELLESVADRSGLNFTVHRMPTNSGLSLVATPLSSSLVNAMSSW